MSIPISKKLKVGDVVRLLNSVPRSRNVPEGREDHRSATVSAVFPDGGLHLDRDLNGMRWWHSNDVQRCSLKSKGKPK